MRDRLDRVAGALPSLGDVIASGGIAYHRRMKLTFQLTILLATFVGCGGATGTDAGADGSSDATSNDSSTTDASSDSSTSDAAADAKGLGAGDPCDPKNDQCGAGLKCCTGGAVQLDGGVGHCTTPTDAGTCPLVP